MHLFDLPPEIIDNITSTVDRSTRYSLKFVCRRFPLPADHANVCDIAAFDGHLGIVKWANTIGYVYSAESIWSAASSGHLHIIEYLRELGCDWHTNTIDAATRNGHLNVVKYAITNGCPWSEFSFYYAAENGHLHILKYLHDNRTLDTLYHLFASDAYMKSWCLYAAKGGHIHIIEWCRQCGVLNWADYARLGSQQPFRADVMNWLRDSGVKMKKRWWTRPVEQFDPDMLDWLYEKGCPNPEYVREYANIYGRHPGVIAWADSKGL